MAADADGGPLDVIEDLATGNHFVLYTTKAGVELECRFDGDAPWFTQRDMAGMFGVDVRTVSEHIQRFRDDGEIDASTIRDFRTVRAEGSRTVERQIEHYGLDVAFYVGYRVNSTAGKLFRRWATAMLVQLATKGFVVNKRMLKGAGNTDRLRELRDIIKDIRSEEANLYAEVRAICAMCSDYDATSDAATRFYQQMQAKLFYAVVSNTPAGHIATQADASKENMGLHTWTGERPIQSDSSRRTKVLTHIRYRGAGMSFGCARPPHQPRARDPVENKRRNHISQNFGSTVSGVAKNDLAEPEVKELNTVTSILLDVFQDQVDVGRLTTMAECTALLDNQLKLLGRAILKTPIPPPHSEAAKTHCKEHYRVFNERRREALRAEADAALAALKAEAKALPKPSRRKK